MVELTHNKAFGGAPVFGLRRTLVPRAADGSPHADTGSERFFENQLDVVSVFLLAAFEWWAGEATPLKIAPPC